MTEPREALARLRRVETRPAGRGMVIIHEIDESHPANDSCDICALVTLRSEGPGLDALDALEAVYEAALSVIENNYAPDPDLRYDVNRWRTLVKAVNVVRESRALAAQENPA